MAPGGCQAEGSWHPDGTACLPESGGDTSRLRDHRPCSSDCPRLRLSGAHKHSWLWGSPRTSTWKCKRATGPVTAVQMLGAGRHSPVWGSPRVGIRYRDTSLTELPQVGVRSISFPGSTESPHVGLRDIPNCGAITHGHLELTAPQTRVRTNSSLSPVQINAMHRDQVPAKPKPARLRN